MRILFRTVSVLLMVLLLGQPVRASCLEYEAQTVELQGLLTVETFPGPPNYTDLKKGDQPEHVWILTLTKPTCVNANAADELYRAVPRVSRIQVAPRDLEDFPKYESFLGHKVVVSGTLFPAHTVHHRTEVLITFETISRVKGG